VAELVDFDRGTEVGPGVVSAGSALLALTRATAAWAPCCKIVSHQALMKPSPRVGMLREGIPTATSKSVKSANI